MPAETRLLQGATPSIVFANGTTIGLRGGGSGRATQLTPAPGSLRSAERPADIDTSPEFERALLEAGIREQETIHVDVDPAPAALRGQQQADTLVLRPHIPPGDAESRVVLYQDESGGLSWHFAGGSRLTDEQRARAAARGFRQSEGTEFAIPLRAISARRALVNGAPRGTLRGPITKIGRKVFKILILPLVSRLLARPIEQLVAPVEQKFRPNLIWQPTPSTYTTRPRTAFTDWASLDGKPTLLIVHGILSTVEGMLGGLPRSAMERWHDRYGGRVLAFNHQSVSRSPEENATFFLEEARRAAPGASFELDVVCHSRGGVVSRAMAERGRRLVADSNCTFRSVFFVASPNRGSILGNADHTVDMIDVFTNLLTSAPDGPVVYSIEVLLAIVKAVAHSAQTTLPGVVTMGTHGYLPDVLNAAREKSPAKYGAAAADYVPSAGSDNGWLIDRLSDAALDRLFEEDGSPVKNDLVVPHDGVFGRNGHPSFPIADPLLFTPADRVWHSGFFARDETVRHIDGHLGIARDPIAVPATGAHRIAERPGFRGGALESSEQGAVPPPIRLERIPQIDFHELVKEGETWDLVVRLNDSSSAAESAARLALALGPGEESLSLTVELSAPGFDVIGSRQCPIVVSRKRDPSKEQARFTLRALNPGKAPLVREIVATFWLDKVEVGASRHFTTVKPAAYTGNAVPDGRDFNEPIVVAARPREWADLVIYVRQLGKADEAYDVSVRCQVPGQEYDLTPMGTMTITAGLTKYLSDFLDPPFRAFPDPTLPDDRYDSALAEWNAAFLVTLNDLGKQLWTMLPSAFRSEYLRLASGSPAPRSISVHSDEMILPWEIIVPSGAIDGRYAELPMLGAAHVMGRWKPGLGARPQPQALPIRHMAIANPQYAQDSLSWSAREATELTTLMDAADAASPLRRSDLNALLARDDIQFFHFSGHGDWDGGTNADLSALRLEGGDTLPAAAFASTRLGAEAHPILFLNACTVGRAGIVIGRPGGFAANCLLAGWSGVVAPYWPVYDPEAYAFSLSFYRKLKLGRSLGEALQELRVERPGDPTAQSYSYFGDPWARALLD
jgi:hypothetical protein